MGYPNKPASIARAINELNPDAEFIVDGDTVIWGTGTPNENGEFVSTETVPANCSPSEIAAKRTELENDRANALLRLERDKRLAETDWWGFSDTTAMTDAQKTYRQALRDLPSTQNPTIKARTNDAIDNVTWPVKPS
tara:strand:+ start:1980 stop:2390 length:411 start_codon:yes stop_codon:yes gene_type:complete